MKRKSSSKAESRSNKQASTVSSLSIQPPHSPTVTPIHIKPSSKTPLLSSSFLPPPFPPSTSHSSFLTSYNTYQCIKFSPSPSPPPLPYIQNKILKTLSPDDLESFGLESINYATDPPTPCLPSKSNLDTFHPKQFFDSCNIQNGYVSFILQNDDKLIDEVVEYFKIYLPTSSSEGEKLATI